MCNVGCDWVVTRPVIMLGLSHICWYCRSARDAATAGGISGKVSGWVLTLHFWRVVHCSDRFGSLLTSWSSRDSRLNAKDGAGGFEDVDDMMNNQGKFLIACPVRLINLIPSNRLGQWLVFGAIWWWWRVWLRQWPRDGYSDGPWSFVFHRFFASYQ